MAENLFSPSWYRVTGLKPRLRSHARIHRHNYRDQLWYVLQDPSSGKFHRFRPAAYHLIGLMDGERTVDEIWELGNKQLGDEAPTQEETIQFLGQLHAADVLRCDVPPDCVELFQRHQKQQRQKWKQRLTHPLAVRIPLFDPYRILTRWLPFVRPLFGWLGAAVWLTVVVTGLVLAGVHWSDLTENVVDKALTPRNLFMLWLIYPVVKALHEFGHACFTHAWGGKVREMGIMLLVFFPVPYVDSSSAYGFSDRKRRMLVSAAGIMVELFLASIALLVWVNTDSGALHDMAFDVVIIGGLSTVIFNANPLLRFDGYYILSELIQIPNLGKRSQQYLGYLFKHHVLAIPGLQSPVTARGEKKWLFSYGIGAGIYRVFITLFIAFWVASKFFIVGFLLALWAIIVQMIYPTLKNFYLLFPIARQANRLDRLGIVVSIFLIVFTVSLLVPAGNSTYAEGVVSLPENAYIRAGTDGIVSRIVRQDGSRVEPGVTVLLLENIELETRHDILLARLEEARARHKDAFLQDRTQFESLKAKVLTLEAVEFQLSSLQVTSAVPGVVCLPLAGDLPGRYVSRGEVIGYIADLDQVTAQVVVHQSDIDRVRRQSQTIKVKLSSRPGETHTATLIRELPQAIDRLPSRLLGSGAGGDVAVDARDEYGVQTISNIFQVEISLPAKIASGKYLGQRIYVRFIHEPESLGNQILSWLRQILLQPPFV